jgi:hypothetical protein
VFLNIVLSGALNHKGVVPSKAQQYVIGLISGSAGPPVKTVVTYLFGKVPKKFFYIPYGAAYSFCIICFVVTLVYTLGTFASLFFIIIFLNYINFFKLFYFILFYFILFYFSSFSFSFIHFPPQNSINPRPTNGWFPQEYQYSKT